MASGSTRLSARFPSPSTRRPGCSCAGRPRTRELYTSLLANHLRPTFGDSPLVKITPLAVRAWRAERLAAGIGGSTIAKAYRLLKAILATAVQDELIARNPCLLPGAGSERPPERIPAHDRGG